MVKLSLTMRIISKLYIYVFFIFILFSCKGFNNEEGTTIEIEQLNSEDSILLEIDKKKIIDCFHENVDYFRTHPNEIDHGNLFEPFGSYYGGDAEGYLKHKKSSREILNVHIGKVIYNSDKLMSVIFLGVKQVISDTSIEMPLIGREFCAMCLIGLRNDVKENFTLYPFRAFEEIGYSNFETPLKIIENKFSNDLASLTDMWGNKYKTNINEKDFWINNLLFNKVVSRSGDTLFYFQTYSLSDLDGKSWNNHHEYKVIQCCFLTSNESLNNN